MHVFVIRRELMDYCDCAADVVCVLQYFYNPETCQFIYWNYETQSYHPVATDRQTVNTSDEQTNDADDRSSSEPATAVDNKAKKEKALHAKKIVKVSSF